MVDQTLNYHSTIDWLFNLQFFGIKLGLETIRTLAAGWGNPERRYPVIHVAGSNGKGSTACFIAAALQAAGYRTGLYTSPHLVDFSERIRIDGVPISEADVVRYAQELHVQVDAMKATFFETTTLMAFQYFAEKNVDVAVIETGLGGRLDATNIVQPKLTVITSLSLEHREHLGDSIEDIAREKGGIIKQGVPLVTAVNSPEAMRVLTGISEERSAPLEMIHGTGSIASIEDIDVMHCRLPELQGLVQIGLVGTHQMENARLAIRGLQCLQEQFPRLNDEVIRTGLREISRLTGLRGRLERLQQHPELVVDVCHNADGTAAMLRTWSAIRESAKTDIIMGMLKSKDIFDMFSIVKQYPVRSLTLVEAASHEAYPLTEMRQAASAAGLATFTAESISAGVHSRLDAAADGSVLLFGSHYVVGDFLRKQLQR